jgi:prepilin-type processing-associated H-X9-DG protein
MVPILPYMEQENLFKLYANFGGLDYSGPRYGGGSNNTVSSTRLKSFTCPSDTPQLWGARTKHNYVVNAGNTTFYQENLPLLPSPSSPRNGLVPCAPGTAGCTPFLGAPFNYYNESDLSRDSTFPFDAPPPPQGPDSGAGRMGRPVALAEITDGTSNTMMLSEVLQGRQDDLRGFTWWGGAAGFTAYMPPNSTEPDVVTGGTCRPLVSPLMPCTTTSTASRPRLLGARSLHTNGVNVAMCDGSIRFVSNNVSIVTWRALSTARGGEVLGDN